MANTERWQGMGGDLAQDNRRLHEALARAEARVAELEAANTGLATEAQRLKAGLRFYARGLHFSPGDAICWDDVSGEPPNFLCDEYGTTIEDGTIAKEVLLGRDAAWNGEDWPPEELPEEVGLAGNEGGTQK